MKTMECKRCGKKITGEPWEMSAHVRSNCPGKPKVKSVSNSTLIEPSFDALQVIDSLDASTIRAQIAKTERQMSALKALLVVAEANEVKVDTPTV